jgi:hypothetical protein
MTVATSIEVVGIKEALAHLNTLDKSIRRQITVEFRELAAPMLMQAKEDVPGKAPMSGWDRTYTPGKSRDPILPWSGSEAMKITSFVSGKRPRSIGGRTRSLAAFGVKWASRDAVLFDATGQSHTKQGAQMLSVLNQRFGKPSRVMWRAYEQAAPQVQDKMLELVQYVMRQTTRLIAEPISYTHKVPKGWSPS